MGGAEGPNSIAGGAEISAHGFGVRVQRFTYPPCLLSGVPVTTVYLYSQPPQSLSKFSSDPHLGPWIPSL
jgi:hypothetical protein